MENNPTLMLVVAAALVREDGRWLLHRRPFGKAHAGLWEFPGGKAESGETPHEALAREMMEECGVELSRSHLTPAGFAFGDGAQAGRPILLLLFKCSHWIGEPEPREGGELGWFSSDEIAALPKPPLDEELCERLLP